MQHFREKLLGLMIANLTKLINKNLFIILYFYLINRKRVFVLFNLINRKGLVGGKGVFWREIYMRNL